MFRNVHECVGPEAQPQPRRDLGKQSDWRVREGLCVGGGGAVMGEEAAFLLSPSPFPGIPPPFILGEPCDSSDLVAKSRATLL